jgi:short-subunit dehydrogenase
MKKELGGRWAMVTGEAGPVGRAAVSGLLRGKAEVVPGLLTKLLVFSTRLAPRPLQASIAGGLMS